MNTVPTTPRVTPERTARAAFYDTRQAAVVIDHLSITDIAVLTESRRWSSGRRGPALSEAEMAGVDLSGFVTQAIAVGVHAIGSAGGIQEKFNLEGLVAEVGDRTTEATSRAATATAEAIIAATAAMERASAEAKKVISDAGTSARQSFSDNVDGARRSLADEINRLVGGSNPELLAKLGPVLDKFSHELDERASKQTSAMAKHNQELSRQQRSLSDTLEKNHKELEAKVDELATAFRVARSASEAAAATAKVTTLKGGTFEQGLHQHLSEIAAGLGDEYTETGATPGAISRCKKGDGLLDVDGGAVRVVIEMTD